MKMFYILILSLPLINGLVNNITDKCQCTCKNPYLGTFIPGNNLFDIVKKSFKIFDRNKIYS